LASNSRIQEDAKLRRAEEGDINRSMSLLLETMERERKRKKSKETRESLMKVGE
jgi:hypothetical protein